MAQITLQFESSDKNHNLEQQAEAIQNHLSGLEEVSYAEAEADTKRFTGLEVVGAISVGIAIVGKSQEFVAALRRLIPELKKLAQDLGFSKVTIDVSGKQIPIADLEKLPDNEMTRADQE
jgi:hypothetical protein